MTLDEDPVSWLLDVAFDPDPYDDPFWDQVDREGPDDCWPWQGIRWPTGYGNTRRGASHRVAFALMNGPIPAGLFVCHRCDNPPCCNPAHLYAGTPKDNTRDMFERHRDRVSRGHLPPPRQTCKRGHPIESDAWGHRCKVCHDEAKHRYRERQRVARLFTE